MKMLSVTLLSEDSKKIEAIFKTTDYSNLKNLLKINKLSDYKILDWKIKDICLY